MTGIVAALQAVVIIRGYSRICGEISAEMHTGTPSSRAQVVGDHPLVGRVGVGVDAGRSPTASTPGRTRAASAIASRLGVGGASTDLAERRRCARRSRHVSSRGTGGAGNSICRSYMS